MTDPPGGLGLLPAEYGERPVLFLEEDHVLAGLDEGLLSL
jgi:hypothetical protein